MYKKFVILVLVSFISLFAEFQPGVYTTDSVYIVNNSNWDLYDTTDTLYETQYGDTIPIVYPNPGYVMGVICGTVEKPLNKIYNDSTASNVYSQFFMKFNFSHENDSVFLELDDNSYKGKYWVLNDSIVKIDIKPKLLPEDSFTVSFVNNQVFYRVVSAPEAVGNVNPNFWDIYSIYDISDLYELGAWCAYTPATPSSVSPIYGGHHFLSKESSSLDYEGHNNSPKYLDKSPVIWLNGKRVELTGIIDKRFKSISIHNLQGRCVFSGNFNSVKKEIDVPQIKAGNIYILHIKERKNIKSIKFIYD